MHTEPAVVMTIRSANLVLTAPLETRLLGHVPGFDDRRSTRQIGDSRFVPRRMVADGTTRGCRVELLDVETFGKGAFIYQEDGVADIGQMIRGDYGIPDLVSGLVGRGAELDKARSDDVVILGPARYFLPVRFRGGRIVRISDQRERSFRTNVNARFGRR